MRNRSLLSTLFILSMMLAAVSCGSEQEPEVDASAGGQTESAVPEETKRSDTFEQKD